MKKSVLAKRIRSSLKGKREQELITWCYENEDKVSWEQLENYHFRLYSKLTNITVDVWPISQKFYNKTMAKSRIYWKPEELKKYLKI